ncbi:Serine/arginine repetitive matrix-like protein [Heracleum sosnowskyi]|uniref:Serine/arginine repetitive matrix-like protein n=1 Tax=Heracleum sosnowskyi TaxID=360622 RepID=A0AAD8JH16_9APIA|nr:Serine/arginine repetitive matrix-like protein [Heracleum sosnowskyi]
MTTTPFLRGHFHPQTLISPRSKSNLNPNCNQTRSRRRKRSPSVTETNNIAQSRNKSLNRTVVSRPGPKQLVNGQVKILKRGEKLDDLVLSSTDRLGPDPDTVQEQIRVFNGLYAGSPSVLASPPPSSLPFPCFFTKRNDVATSDLRRLLRLN